MFILKNSYDDYLGSLETTHQKKICIEKRKEHTYIKKNPQWDRSLNPRYKLQVLLRSKKIIS